MKKRLGVYSIVLVRAVVSCVAIIGSASAQDVVTYYHTDLAGSTVAGSDSNGNIIWREDYTPYGEKRLEQLSSGDNRRAFTGHPHEDFTGLTYAGARHYDPMIGRFISVDPVGPNAEDQFGFDRFAYGNNNPYAFVDLDGREPTRSQSVTWAQARQIIEGRSNVTLANLRYIENVETTTGKQVGPFGGDHGARYIWTTNRGWIDLGHFFSAAAGAQKKIGDGAGRRLARSFRSYTDSKLWEVTSALENSQGPGSKWAYEDAPTNKAGADFYLDYYRGDATLVEDLNRFFGDAGAADPTTAPNWRQMQQTEQKNKLLFNENKSFKPDLKPTRKK